MRNPLPGDENLKEDEDEKPPFNGKPKQPKTVPSTIPMSRERDLEEFTHWIAKCMITGFALSLVIIFLTIGVRFAFWLFP